MSEGGLGGDGEMRRPESFSGNRRSNGTDCHAKAKNQSTLMKNLCIKPHLTRGQEMGGGEGWIIASLAFWSATRKRAYDRVESPRGSKCISAVAQSS